MWKLFQFPYKYTSRFKEMSLQGYLRNFLASPQKKWKKEKEKYLESINMFSSDVLCYDTYAYSVYHILRPEVFSNICLFNRPRAEDNLWVVSPIEYIGTISLPVKIHSHMYNNASLKQIGESTKILKGKRWHKTAMSHEWILKWIYSPYPSKHFSERVELSLANMFYKE